MYSTSPTTKPFSRYHFKNQEQEEDEMEEINEEDKIKMKQGQLLDDILSLVNTHQSLKIQKLT
jgi:hypothetical protein